MKKIFLPAFFIVLCFPFFAHASTSNLKTTTDKIYDFELSTDTKNNDFVKYSYTTNEVPPAKNEDITKRTENSQTFNLDNGVKETKFFVGLPFLKINDKWLNVDTATTTLEIWNANYKISRIDQMKNWFLPRAALADIYYQGAGDGTTYKHGSSWADTHDAITGTGADPTDTIGSCGTVSSNYDYRFFAPVDTSTIPDDAIITSAKQYFFAVSGGGYLQYTDNDELAFISVVDTTQPDSSTFTTSDYNNFNYTQGGSSLRLDALTPDAINYIDLNATGLSWINKTGYTLLGILEGHDINNNAVAGNDEVGIRTSEYTGTDNDPYLDITWTTGGGGETPATSTAPMAFLDNSTVQMFYLVWYFVVFLFLITAILNIISAFFYFIFNLKIKGHKKYLDDNFKKY